MRRAFIAGAALVAMLFVLGTGKGSAGEAGPAAPPPGSASGKPVPATGDADVAVEHGKINTADASPVAPGAFEVEVGYSYLRSKRLFDRDADTQRRGLTREHAVDVAFATGITDNVDVGVAAGYHWVRDDDNDYDELDGEFGPRHGDHFGDLEFGARYRFLNLEPQRFEMAWIAGFTAPTGSDNCRREIGTSQEYWSLDQSLVASKDWGRLTANAEAGYSLPFGEDRDDSRGTAALNLAAGYQALDWLQPELELNYEREFVKDDYDPELIAGTAGLVMALSDTVSAKAGVQEGLWGRNTDKATTLILVVKFSF